MIIPVASHTDLYDRMDKIPFDRITDFFGQHLVIASQLDLKITSRKRRHRLPSSIYGKGLLRSPRAQIEAADKVFISMPQGRNFGRDVLQQSEACTRCSFTAIMQPICELCSKLFSGLDHKFAHLCCDVLLADIATCRLKIR